MKHFCYFLFISLFIISPITVYAQDCNGIPNIQSPNATDLGKYGDIPVSLYTGRANVSIPLYTLSVRGTQMPISLDYDTSGLLMNSLPGWTGHNWTLNVGGVITRSMKGIQDELSERQYQNAQSVGHFHSDFDMNSYLQDLWTRMINLTHDTGVDEFTFNFMGYSGRFFYGNDGEWKVYSDHNIDVLFNVEDTANYISPFLEKYPGISKKMPKVIKGFILRDEQGNMYEFGGDNSSIDYSMGFMSQTNTNTEFPWIANSWYLRKVRDRFGNVLFTLEYERGVYVAHIYRHLEITSAIEHRNHISNPIHGNFLDVHNQMMPFRGELISPVYLRKVVGRNGVSVDFHSSYLPMGLDEMYGAEDKDEEFGYRFTEALRKRMEDRPPMPLPIEVGGNEIYNYPYYYLQNPPTNSPYQYNPSASIEDKYMNPLGQCRLKKLDSICIHAQNSDSTAIIFELDYNYKNRMHLTSVVEKDNPSALQAEKEYTFKYHKFQSIPKYYLTKLVDHWGYFNNTPFYYQHEETDDHGGISIEDDQLPFTNKGYPTVSDFEINPEGGHDLSYHYLFTQSRKVNEQAALDGMLTEISYPMGGRTVLEYESNDYAKLISDDRSSVIVDKTIDDFFEEEYNSAITTDPPIGLPQVGDSLEVLLPIDSINRCGGLRLKSITNYDGQNIIYQKHFSYLDPNTGKSSGVLFSRPRYSWSWTLRENIYAATFQDVSILPLSNSFGPHVGYSYVKESDSNGSVLYNYQNIDATLDLPPDRRFVGPDCGLSPYDHYSERGYKRGKLLHSWTYNKQDELVAETGITYDEDGLEDNFVYTSNAENGTFTEYGGKPFYGSIYKLFYPKYVVKEQIDSIKNGSLWDVTKTKYFYKKDSLEVTHPYIHNADFCKVTDQTTIHGNDSSSVLYTYAFDSTETKAIAQRYFYLTPLKTTYTHNNVPYKEERTAYQQRDGHYLPAAVTVKQNYLEEDTLIVYNDYTDTYALKRFTRSGELPVQVYWDPTDTSVLGMVQGNYNLLSTLNTINNWSQIRKDYPQLSVSSYTYDSLGNLTSITVPNGNREYYEYGFGNRLTKQRNTFMQLMEEFLYHYQSQK